MTVEPIPVKRADTQVSPYEIAVSIPDLSRKDTP